MLERLIINLRRIRQFFWYSLYILTRAENWWDFYKDVFGIFKTDWILITKDKIKIQLRPGSVDRWSALETLILKLNKLYLFEDTYDTIVDVGAHIGDSTLDFAYTYPKAKIIAIEPIQSNVAQIKKNLLLNKLEKRVTVLDAALTTSIEKTLKLFTNQDNAASSLVRSYSDDFVEVKALHLEDLKSYIKGKALLKMDIEGEEYSIFTQENLDFIKLFDAIILESHYVSTVDNSDKLKRFLDQNNIKSYVKNGRFFYITKIGIK